MPKLNEMHEKYAKKGLVLIGVHSDPKTAEGKKSVAETGAKYPIAYDGGALMKAFNCDSFPDYVIIDKKGIVRVVDLANGEIEKAVKMLLEEKVDDK